MRIESDAYTNNIELLGWVPLAKLERLSNDTTNRESLKSATKGKGSNEVL